jgi:predicted choloylglycine hydrolase
VAYGRINGAGLTVSLTFGGRPEVGEGFGIPLGIPYVLEVCRTVDQIDRIDAHSSRVFVD